MNTFIGQKPLHVKTNCGIVDKDAFDNLWNKFRGKSFRDFVRFRVKRTLSNDQNPRNKIDTKSPNPLLFHGIFHRNINTHIHYQDDNTTKCYCR